MKLVVDPQRLGSRIECEVFLVYLYGIGYRYVSDPPIDQQRSSLLNEILPTGKDEPAGPLIASAAYRDSAGDVILISVLNKFDVPDEHGSVGLNMVHSVFLRPTLLDPQKTLDSLTIFVALRDFYRNGDNFSALQRFARQLATEPVLDDQFPGSELVKTLSLQTPQLVSASTQAGPLQSDLVLSATGKGIFKQKVSIVADFPFNPDLAFAFAMVNLCERPGRFLAISGTPKDVGLVDALCTSKHVHGFARITLSSVLTVMERGEDSADTETHPGSATSRLSRSTAQRPLHSYYEKGSDTASETTKLLPGMRAKWWRVDRRPVRSVKRSLSWGTVLVALLLAMLSSASFGVWHFSTSISRISAKVDRIWDRIEELSLQGSQAGGGRGGISASEQKAEGQREPATPDRLDTPTRRALHMALLARRPYIRESLPRGASSLSQEPLRTFVDDLAAVLSTTKWVVEVEVHTDLSGNPDTNKMIAEKRGELLRDALIKTGVVSPDQLILRAVGDADPVIGDERGPEDRARNRRVVVRRLQ